MPVWKRPDDPDDELNEEGIHPVVAEYGRMLQAASREFEEAL